MNEKKEHIDTKDNSIFSEDNLITGSIEADVQVKQEFENWYKVKIQGLVNSYKIHEDGSLQLKFQEKIEKKINNISFIDFQDRSIRIRKESPFTAKEAQNFIGKNVEILDVEEKAQYKKIAEGQYDFKRITGYVYSANNIKVINKEVESNYQLFKIFEFKVKQVAPAIRFDQRKRTQVLDKDNSVLIYEVKNDTLISLHKITAKGLSYEKAKSLIAKDIIVLDLQEVGSNNYCSKIKLK